MGKNGKRSHAQLLRNNPLTNQTSFLETVIPRPLGGDLFLEALNCIRRAIKRTHQTDRNAPAKGAAFTRPLYREPTTAHSCISVIYSYDPTMVPTSYDSRRPQNSKPPPSWLGADPSGVITYHSTHPLLTPGKFITTRRGES